MDLIVEDILVLHATGNVLLVKQLDTDDVIVSISYRAFINVC